MYPYLTKGLFTRMTANFVSALDLFLEDELEDTLVSEMSIDTYGKILGGSDHSAKSNLVQPLMENRRKQEIAKILLEQQKLHATKNHRIGPL